MKRPQRFAGTDRQVRGLLMDVLRAAEGPVPAAALDAVWSFDAQRARALDGLVADGLVDPLPDGTFALPGLPGLREPSGPAGPPGLPEAPEPRGSAGPPPEPPELSGLPAGQTSTGEPISSRE